MKPRIKDLFAGSHQDEPLWPYNKLEKWFSLLQFSSLCIGFIIVYSIGMGVLAYVSQPQKYANNDKYIYWDRKKIPGSDGKSFALVGGDWTTAKDKNSVYYRGEKVNGADPETFQYLGQSQMYRFKDKNYAYEEYYNKKTDKFDLKKVTDLDINSYQPIKASKAFHSVFSRDNNGVYYMQIKIVDADTETFQHLGGFYAKDKNNVYHREKALDGADTNSFETIESPDQRKSIRFDYAKDTNTAYCNGKKIQGSDPKTFKALSGNYAKDNNYAYWDHKKIEDSDGRTFETLGLGWAQDKNNKYKFGNKQSRR